MNLVYYLSLFPAYTRDMPRFSALAEAVLRQAVELMILVPGLDSGFFFCLCGGETVGCTGGVGFSPPAGRLG